ncbi:MAG: hypothetical protein ACJ8EL_02915 [Rhizomicrobium sp.]
MEGLLGKVGIDGGVGRPGGGGIFGPGIELVEVMGRLVGKFGAGAVSARARSTTTKL